MINSESEDCLACPSCTKHLCKSNNLRASKIQEDDYTQTIAIPKLFIGMDVHKKSWTVHFKTDLFDNKTVAMPADPAALVTYIEKKSGS